MCSTDPFAFHNIKRPILSSTWAVHQKRQGAISNYLQKVIFVLYVVFFLCELQSSYTCSSSTFCWCVLHSAPNWRECGLVHQMAPRMGNSEWVGWKNILGAYQCVSSKNWRVTNVQQSAWQMAVRTMRQSLRFIVYWPHLACPFEKKQGPLKKAPWTNVAAQ